MKEIKYNFFLKNKLSLKYFESLPGVITLKQKVSYCVEKAEHSIWMYVTGSTGCTVVNVWSPAPVTK